MVATGDQQGSVQLWDSATGKALARLARHTAAITSLAFSPDNTQLASASWDRSARLWDIRTGQELFALPEQGQVVTRVAFSPEGAQLAVGSRDGLVHLYLLKLNELVELAKTRVTRTLTTEECKRYLHLASCPTLPPH